MENKYSIGEIASLYGVSRFLVRRWVSLGLPCYLLSERDLDGVVYFLLDDVECFLSTCKQGTSLDGY